MTRTRLPAASLPAPLSMFDPVYVAGDETIANRVRSNL